MKRPVRKPLMARCLDCGEWHEQKMMLAGRCAACLAKRAASAALGSEVLAWV